MPSDGKHTASEKGPKEVKGDAGDLLLRPDRRARGQEPRLRRRRTRGPGVSQVWAPGPSLLASEPGGRVRRGEAPRRRAPGLRGVSPVPKNDRRAEGLSDPTIHPPGQPNRTERTNT